MGSESVKKISGSTCQLSSDNLSPVSISSFLHQMSKIFGHSLQLIWLYANFSLVYIIEQVSYLPSGS